MRPWHRRRDSPSDLTEEQVRKSLRSSILDGSAYSVMLGLTQNYITPYALTMKATTRQIGLLTSVPSFLMAAVQFAAPALSEKSGSRKGFILPLVVAHALMWLPILLIPYLFSTHQVWWLIALMTISTAFDAAVKPAWGSMMADLVPREYAVDTSEGATASPASYPRCSRMSPAASCNCLPAIPVWLSSSYSQELSHQD